MQPRREAQPARLHASLPLSLPQLQSLPNPWQRAKESAAHASRLNGSASLAACLAAWLPGWLAGWLSGSLADPRA